jgi:hypothetical protein
MRKSFRIQSRWFASLLLLGFLIGCTSTKTVWNSRIGTYHFDQAVLELGPPDKAASLTDGTLVADWLTRRGSPGGFTDPFYAYPPAYHRRYHHYWGPPLSYYDPPTPDYFLRLTFGPDGNLSAWQRLAR